MALDETVKRLRALLEKATPGKWEANGWAGGITGHGAARRFGLERAVEVGPDIAKMPEPSAFVTVPHATLPGGVPDSSLLLAMTMDERAAEDAQLIAAAVSALPDLLAAADLLCRLRAIDEQAGFSPPLNDALEWARREQTRERGGSDGK